MIANLLRFLIYLSLFVSCYAHAIGSNATHTQETDLYILKRGDFDGQYTSYAPAFSDPVPQGVAIDEVYLRIKFESGQTPSIGRLKDVSCNGDAVFDVSEYLSQHPHLVDISLIVKT